MIRSLGYFLVLIVGSAGQSVKADGRIWLLAGGTSGVTYIYQEKEITLAKFYQDIRISQGDRFDVIFENKVAFKSVSTMRDILEKKGATSVRYFSFSRDSGRMMEVVMGGVFPLPDHPGLDFAR